MRILFFGTSLLLGLIQAASASADTVQEATARLANDVKQFLDGKEVTSVSLGSFQGRGEAVLSGGDGIKHHFAEALKAKGIDVKLRSAISIVGAFEPVEDAGDQQQALKLTVELLEKNSPPRTFERIVLNQSQVAEFTGRAVAFEPSNTSSENKRNLKEAIDDPKATVEGSIIKANNGQPFAIEILVAPNTGRRKDIPTPLEVYRSQTAKVDEGFAFVPIARNQVYAVRLINQAPFAVAVALKIDGLNMFTAAEKKGPKGDLPYTHLIVKSGEKNAVVIKGWFVNELRSEEFLVTSFAESLAGSLGVTSDIGTITATFHAAWPSGTPPPADERKAGDKNSQGGDATGRGASFEQKYVLAEMDVGVPRAVIPVRYTR